jgi:hypothetical protein
MVDELTRVCPQREIGFFAESPQGTPRIFRIMIRNYTIRK